MLSKRLERIANSYYNMGLKNARERNLATAISCLEKALEFHKNQVDARNLLGLIYYETGEIGQALICWVISINIKKSNNIAEFYIFELQKKPAQMKIYGQIIEKYNQALSYARNNNADLAILSLTKVADTHPKYIRAGLLLALLCIQKEDYTKADRVLGTVLKTDKYHPLALRYRACIRDFVSGKQGEKKRGAVNRPAEDVIIPSTYKPYTGWQTVVNIGIGLLIGAAAIMFLYIPTMRAKLHSEYNAELGKLSATLNTSNVEKDVLLAKIDELTLQTERLTEAQNTSAENINYKSTQYQKLLAMLQAYDGGDFTRVADLYADFDASVISNIDDGSGFSVQSVIDMIRQKMDAEGSGLLLSHGDGLMSAGNYEQALIYYDKALALQKENVAALLKKGQALAALGRTDEANTVFSDIVIHYADTPEAAQAKLERGY